MPRVASDSLRKEILMSSSTGTTSSASIYTTPAFWERLWRTAGIQSVLCFIVAYIGHGHQPQVGASADALAALYDRDPLRIPFAGALYGLAGPALSWRSWAASPHPCGLRAPDGVYSRLVPPAIGLVWAMVVSGVLLTRSPATRAGW